MWAFRNNDDEKWQISDQEPFICWESRRVSPMPEDATHEMVMGALSVDFSNEDEMATARNVWRAMFHAYQREMPLVDANPANEISRLQEIIKELREHLFQLGQIAAYEEAETHVISSRESRHD